jgi:hypothetical protein
VGHSGPFIKEGSIAWYTIGLLFLFLLEHLTYHAKHRTTDT